MDLLTIVVQTYIVPAVTSEVARRLKQKKPFVSRDEEVLLGFQIAAARLIEPWVQFLKTTTGLTGSQYNVLRILRGSHPSRLACTEIGERMIARDPDITRLIDRLARRGLVDRVRSRTDRRVVQVGITAKGLELLKRLDPDVERLPGAMLGHLDANKLRQLGALLEEVLSKAGTFP
jgi:DNA-binding MarR family transcriptional regulator